MLTLLASIVGFVGSIIPEVFKFFKDKNEKAYMLKVLDKEIENYKNSILLKSLEHDLAERKLLQEYSPKSNYKLMDILNGSVRPILAYGFFIVYCTMKYIEYKLVSKHIAPEIFQVWNENDQAIFAGIISFYFGQRAFCKTKKSR